MIFEETYLKDAYIVNLEPHTDKRGYFARLYCKDEFNEIGFKKEFVQINQSLNKHKHTFRGFHYQVPPFSETKLIRCVSGGIIDFIIDIRKDSPTFLKSFSVELSERNSRMLLIPDGFAHGFLTLEDNTSILYFHTEFFAPGYDNGLRFSDPELHIDFPFSPEIISEKDLEWPLIKERSFSGLEIKNTTVSS